MGDGNGWVRCALGHRHWGRFGAAGLLLTDGVHVLLQHRAPWTHEGDTWALPGGARDSHEDAVAAALREAGEETDLDRRLVERRSASWVDDHGGWSYTTVLAQHRAGGAGPARQRGERRGPVVDDSGRRHPSAAPRVRGRLAASARHPRPSRPATTHRRPPIRRTR